MKYLLGKWNGSDKHNLARTILKEHFFLSHQGESSEMLALLKNNHTPYFLNINSHKFGKIQLEKSLLEKDICKGYDILQLAPFFSHLETIQQITIFVNPDVSMLRLKLSDDKRYSCPVALFWHCLDGNVRQQYPDSSDIVDNVRHILSSRRVKVCEHLGSNTKLQQ